MKKFPSIKSVRQAFIRSALVQADIQSLENQMAEDESLSELLMTPAKELPVKYSYLLAEVFDGWETLTLYHLIAETFTKVPSNQIYFSKAGDKIIGWCAYTTEYSRQYKQDIVNEIKMFSFDINRPNPVLLRDLETLIKTLLDKYGIIFWAAVKENPANRIYERAIEKYKGTKEEYNNLVYYTIMK